MTDSILVDHAFPPMAVVTLNRPSKRNAVTLHMWRQLAQTFTTLSADGTVRAILLTGYGAHFSAGADIYEFQSLRHDAKAGGDYDSTVDAAVESIMSSSKPTIAAIAGVCVGGGCSLAMACDFRIAQSNATFGIPAARLGIVYGALDTRNLMALVGVANAKRILFSGETIAATDALRMGLIDEVTNDSPFDAARDFGHLLAANAPISIAGSKSIIAALHSPLSDDCRTAAIRWQRSSLNSSDYQERVRAYIEKRRATFDDV